MLTFDTLTLFLFFFFEPKHCFSSLCLSLPNESGRRDNSVVTAYLTPFKLLKDPLRGFGATRLPVSKNKGQAKGLCW